MPSYQHHEKRFNKSSAYGLAKAAYSTAMFVKDAVNIEYKEHVVNVTPTPLDAEGNVWELVSNGALSGTSIQQGIQNGERIGDSIKLQRLTFRGLLVKNSDQPLSAVRIILFKGKAEGGEQYLPSDILQNLDVFSPKLEENKFNTKFIYDEVFIVDSVKSQYVEFDWNKELNWHCNYVAGANTVGDGGLYLLMVTTAASTPGGVPVWSGTFKITYTDD